MSYQCPLGKLIPEITDYEKIKRDGWADHRILVVSVDDPRLDVFERQFILNIGNRLALETG